MQMLKGLCSPKYMIEVHYFQHHYQFTSTLCLNKWHSINTNVQVATWRNPSHIYYLDSYFLGIIYHDKEISGRFMNSKKLFKTVSGLGKIDNRGK